MYYIAVEGAVVSVGIMTDKQQNHILFDFQFQYIMLFIITG